jgi:hypothetical protein
VHYGSDPRMSPPQRKEQRRGDSHAAILGSETGKDSHLPPNGRLETWYDFTSVHDGMVEYAFCAFCHQSADSPELIYIARPGN